jgi:hypothetical protein
VFHCMEEELKNEEILAGDKCHGITVRLIQKKKQKKQTGFSTGSPGSPGSTTGSTRRAGPGLITVYPRSLLQTLRDHLLYVKCKFWIQGRWKLY